MAGASCSCETTSCRASSPPEAKRRRRFRALFRDIAPSVYSPLAITPALGERTAYFRMPGEKFRCEA